MGRGRHPQSTASQIEARLSVRGIIKSCCDPAQWVDPALANEQASLLIRYPRAPGRQGVVLIWKANRIIQRLWCLDVIRYSVCAKGFFPSGIHSSMPRPNHNAQGGFVSEGMLRTLTAWKVP